MNRPLLLLPLLSFLFGVGVFAQDLNFATAAQTPQVTVTLVSEAKKAAPAQPFRVAVKIEHGPHVHTYGKELPEDGTGQTTKLTWILPEGWKADELPWPPVKEVPSTGGALSKGYDGTVLLPAKITPAGQPGDEGAIAVKVRMLVCDDKSCLPKTVEVATKVPLAAAVELDAEIAAQIGGVLNEALPPASTPSMTAAKAPAIKEPLPHSFAALMLFAFVGGLILNVMPCVFPVLGIKVLGVVQQAGGDRRQVVIHGLVYTLGILLCFWALGGIVVAVGKTWGFQLQSPGFLYGLTVFFLIFALNMAGMFEIGAGAVGIGSQLQAKHGYGGSFFSGLLATVVATPCSAPFLSTALGAAVTLPMGQALVMFTMIGFGLASPFLLLSAFPKLVSALPRPGAWMESFKQAMSFLLFGTAGYLLWVLIDKVEGLPMLLLLLSLVLVAAGCWIYGRWCLPHRKPRVRASGAFFALVAVAGGLWLGWPQPEEKWTPWSPERVAELRAAGTPVYIDFTAKWCVTCQFNKWVYKDDQVKELIREKKVVLLKADWTNEDARIEDALAQLGEAAIPVNVLYIPGRDKPLILEKLLTVENVSAVLRQIP
jgi:thiol:disulfide interchange protein